MMFRTGMAVMVLAVSAAGVWAEEAANVTTKDGLVTLKQGDKPVFTYRQGPAPFKSYVPELYTPSGINVIRDNVADHIHHHGLMFALTVNDTDFWIETGKCGKQVSKSLKTRDNGVMDHIDWTTADGKVVMKERRAVRLSAKPGGPNVVTWKMKLEAPEGKPAKLTGAHYSGLGMRFQESMNKIGTFFNSSGQPGELVRGQEYNVPANWCGYTAECDGKPVTVVLFSDPGNARHPTTFFTMPVGFAYQSATLNVYREPLTIEPGKPLALRYGVALWDGKVNSEQVEAAYKEWLTNSKAPKEKESK